MNFNACSLLFFNGFSHFTHTHKYQFLPQPRPTHLPPDTHTLSSGKDMVSNKKHNSLLKHQKKKKKKANLISVQSGKKKKSIYNVERLFVIRSLKKRLLDLYLSAALNNRGSLPFCNGQVSDPQASMDLCCLPDLNGSSQRQCLSAPRGEGFVRHSASIYHIYHQIRDNCGQRRKMSKFPNYATDQAKYNYF